MRSNLISIIFLFSWLFFSCKKASVVTTDDNLVSGKLKSVVRTVPGSTIKIILEVKYDLSNRVTNFNNWYENSASSPAQISSAQYRHFEYNNADQFPSKCITTHDNGKSDTSLFSYDISSRLIQADNYSYSGSHSRNIYNYINSNLIVVMGSIYNGGSSTYAGKDSVTLLSNDNSVLTWRGFDEQGNLSITFSYTYDNQRSPFYELNIYKYLYIIGDLDVGYNALHNFLTYRRVKSGTADHVITNSYSYSSNSFPLTGLGQEGYDPASVATINTIYSYY